MRKSSYNPPVRQDGKDVYINYLLENSRNGDYIPYLAVFYSVIHDFSLARPDLRREEIVIMLNNYKYDLENSRPVKYFGFKREVEGDLRLNILYDYMKKFSRKKIEEYFHQALNNEITLAKPTEKILAEKFKKSLSTERAKNYSEYCLENSVDIFPFVDNNYNLHWVVNNFSFRAESADEFNIFDEEELSKKLSINYDRLMKNYNIYIEEVSKYQPWSDLNQLNVSDIVGMILKIAILEPISGYRFINNGLVWQRENVIEFLNFRVKELEILTLTEEEEIDVRLEWSQRYYNLIQDIRDEEDLKHKGLGKYRGYELNGKYGIRRNWDMVLYYILKVKGLVSQEDLYNLTKNFKEMLDAKTGIFQELDSLEFYESQLNSSDRPMATFIKEIKSYANNNEISLAKARDYLKIQMFINGMINTLNNGRLSNIELSRILFDVADLIESREIYNIEYDQILDITSYLEDGEDKEDIFKNYIKNLLATHIYEFLQIYRDKELSLNEYIKSQALSVYSSTNKIY